MAVAPAPSPSPVRGPAPVGAAPPLPPLPLPALKVTFDRSELRARGYGDCKARARRCAAWLYEGLTGTQMFESFVQSLLPLVYRYSPHSHGGGGGGGGGAAGDAAAAALEATRP